MHLKSMLWSAVAAAALAVAPAYAQKSKDTISIPMIEPIPGVDDYLHGNPENEFYSIAVFDRLISFDEQTNDYVPTLAKSWKRIDERTLEFELRDDVKFHDGAPFTADDVVYTVNWLVDPQVKIRNKNNYDWMKSAEKLGPHKVRIVEVQPTAIDEAQLARSVYILPAHLHGKLGLNEKQPFGMKPVGTGMFIATEVDSNKGVFLKKNPNYKHGGSANPVGNVGNLNLLFVPDQDVRIAKFLVEEVQLLARQVTVDQLDELTKKPGVVGKVVQGPSIAYMALDARGRAGQKALTDVRVRRALFMAINRKDLVTLVSGEHEIDRVPEAMCWKDQVGCDYTQLPPPYDPEGAKKLLAEAGYPNGFDLELATFNTSVSDTAVAVAGHLNKIGVRAKVREYTIAATRLAQRDNKVQAAVFGYPMGNIPDVARSNAYFFGAIPAEDYHGDQQVRAWSDEMDRIADPAQRKALGRKLFDRVTEQAYIMPVAPRPVPMVHRDSITITGSRYITMGFHPGGLNWK